jgi:hypothetical protein
MIRWLSISPPVLIEHRPKMGIIPYRFLHNQTIFVFYENAVFNFSPTTPEKSVTLLLRSKII